MKPTVEIGDSKQEEFYPQVKLSRWNNEANLSARYIGIGPVAPEGVVVEDEKTKIVSEDQIEEAHLYETSLDLYDEYAKDKHDDDIFLGEIEATDTDIQIDGKQIALDSEIERETLKLRASEAYGDVLIVGLGLGLITEYLKYNKNVSSITYVEINQSVIDLVEKEYPGRLLDVQVICADFYEWQTDSKYDYIYGDIFPFFKVGYIKDWQLFNAMAVDMLKKDGFVNTYIDEYAKQILGTDFEQPGYELEVILNEKPETNVFGFSLQYKDVDFLYQPELTQEEIANGSFRPESVEKSYAMYSSKRNGKYKAGKVGHIYRPKIVDANNDWIWGEMDISNDVLSISVDKEWLETAVYPVKVDPTFGYTTIGGSQEDIGNFIVAVKAEGVADVGRSMFAHAGSSSSNLRPLNGAVYKVADDTQITDSQTEEAFANPSTWRELPFVATPTFIVEDYWLAVNGSFVSTKKGSTRVYVSYDTGSAGDGLSVTRTYASTMPDPITAGYTTDDKLRSIYVDAGILPSQLILQGDDF